MSKKFTLIIEETDNQIQIDGENKGFNAFELLGFLRLKEQDIMDQINDQQRDRVNFTRTVKNEDGTILEITEDVKTEPAKSGVWYVQRDPVACETKITCSVCGYVARKYGPLDGSRPVNCPDCGSFMSAEVTV